jgi:hypothetical protein
VKEVNSEMKNKRPQRLKIFRTQFLLFEFSGAPAFIFGFLKTFLSLKEEREREEKGRNGFHSFFLLFFLKGEGRREGKKGEKKRKNMKRAIFPHSKTPFSKFFLSYSF